MHTVVSKQAEYRDNDTSSFRCIAEFTVSLVPIYGLPEDRVGATEDIVWEFVFF